MNIQDAIDVIESVAGFTDESTPVGEAWAEVLSYVYRPRRPSSALAQPEPEGAGVSDEDDVPRLLRRLIGAMIDYMCLPGHVITRDEWEKACLQSGRYCEPFLSGPRSLQPVSATPTIQPVPVSERLPGPEELATLVPLMNSGAGLCHSEGFYEESDAIGRIADLLEQLMPQAGGHQ